MHLEIAHSKGEKPARKTRAGSQLRNELSAAYAKRNLRRVDFRRHHLGCRHRHHHLGCHHHRRPGCHRHRRNFGLVRNRNATAPDSSGSAENKSGARSTSSVLSTSAKAVDYTSAPAANCTSEPGVDYKSAAAKNRDYRGTPAYRDCCVAEARKHGHRSSSSGDCHCYSEAARCAGQSYSCWNRNGQPTGGDPHEVRVLIARAGSSGDSIRRIPSARGPDPLRCSALPKYASCFREAETDCRVSSSSTCAASFPSKRAAGLARIRAEAHCCPSSNPACAACFLSRRAAGFARDRAAAERLRLHREKSPDRHGDRPSRRHLPDG